MEELFIFVPFALGVLVAWFVMRGRAAADADQAAAGGSRRIYWPSWFAVVDVETTSLDPVRGALVSIGAVHPLSGETFYCECWVREGALIESDAMAVNMADWLEDKNRASEAQAVARFMRWAQARGVRLVGGKNPSFDVRHLEAAWKRGQEGLPDAVRGKFPLTHRTLDLHSLALAWALVNRPVSVTAEGFKTDDVYAMLGLPAEPKPHNALTGARMEADAFKVLLERGGVL